MNGISRIIVVTALVALPLAAQTKNDEVRRKVIVGENIRVVEGDDGRTLFFATGGGAYLGISTSNLTEELRTHFGADADAGVLVSKVWDDTPASRAGLRVGDVIVAIEGEEVGSSWDVSAAFRDREKGDQVRIDVIRNGVPQQIFATLDERTGAMRWQFGEEGLLRRETLERALKAVPRALDGEQFRTFRVGPECADLRERLSELEAKMKELEKKLK
ncbi:MAG: S1C family serine protease [Thermoanaerobaculia bacterium]